MPWPMFQHRAHPDRTQLAALGLVPLGDLSPGSGGLVRRLRGRRLLAIRLSALGFSVGVRVIVLRNDRRGPLVVLVRGTRVALGRGAADKILVEVAGDGTDAGSRASG